MQQIKVMRNSEHLQQLIEHVYDPARIRPILIVSCREGSTPALSSADLQIIVSSMADVFVMSSVSFTFEASQTLPNALQTYGGALRLVWPDLPRDADSHASPLKQYAGGTGLLDWVKRKVAAGPSSKYDPNLSQLSSHSYTPARGATPGTARMGAMRGLRQAIDIPEAVVQIVRHNHNQKTIREVAAKTHFSQSGDPAEAQRTESDYGAGSDIEVAIAAPLAAGSAAGLGSRPSPGAHRHSEGGVQGGVTSVPGNETGSEPGTGAGTEPGTGAGAGAEAVAGQGIQNGGAPSLDVQAIGESVHQARQLIAQVFETATQLIEAAEHAETMAVLINDEAERLRRMTDELNAAASADAATAFAPEAAGVGQGSGSGYVVGAVQPAVSRKIVLPLRPNRAAAPLDLKDRVDSGLTLNDTIFWVNSARDIDDLHHAVLDPQRGLPLIIATSSPRGFRLDPIEAAAALGDIAQIAVFADQAKLSEFNYRMPWLRTFNGAWRIVQPGANENTTPYLVAAKDDETTLLTLVRLLMKLGYIEQRDQIEFRIDPSARVVLPLEYLSIQDSDARRHDVEHAAPGRRESDLTKEVRSLRDQLDEQQRKARPRAYADPELQFRHEVHLRYLHLTVNDPTRAPDLPHYTLGPEFLSSFDEMMRDSKLQPEVIYDAVIDIATGAVYDQESKWATHKHGQADMVRTRPNGQTAYRARLETGRASARRIMWWYQSGKPSEIAKVAVHDDFEIK